MKILITGADGFIGSHLLERLVREGYDVRAMALYNAFGTWGWLDDIVEDMHGNFEIVMGDVRDPSGVRDAMRGCDVVLNLAALIGIPYSYHSPGMYLETNVRGTLNILQAARDADIDLVVQTSTSEVYGTARYIPMDEEHPLQAQSPYAATKIAADQLSLSFHRSFSTPVIVLRPFNTYGPRQSARAVIPTVISQIADNQRQLKLGSLTPTRDFTFVEDTVSGFMACIRRREEAIGQVINLGVGWDISIGELVREIAAVMDVEFETVCDEQRVRPEASEVERLLSDNSKAKKLLGWAPDYDGRDGLRRGLEKTVRWMLEPDNLRRFKSEVFNI